MQKYKSTKEVYAEPMNRLEAEKQGLVRDVTGKDEEGYKVIYSDDYSSWSPKKAFDEGYVKIS